MLQGCGTVLNPVTNSPIATQRVETSLGFIELLDQTNEPDHNAHLIASAPELLEALENALNVMAGIATGDLKRLSTESHAIVAARLAIAKAKGQH